MSHQRIHGLVWKKLVNNNEYAALLDKDVTLDKMKNHTNEKWNYQMHDEIVRAISPFKHELPYTSNGRRLLSILDKARFNEPDFYRLIRKMDKDKSTFAKSECTLASVAIVIVYICILGCLVIYKYLTKDIFL
jgi:hypothetical protein